MKTLAILFIAARKILRRIRMHIIRHAFKQCGKNFIFDPDGEYSFKTISVGSDVFIGSGAKFLASNSTITIGSKVMFGPNVTVLGGDHNTSSVGKFMFDCKEKKQGDDLPVVFEDDTWIGAGSIILKGVTVSRGSIIAAGSVVTKDVPEYTIVAGVPARPIDSRFEPDVLQQHKRLLLNQHLE